MLEKFLTERNVTCKVSADRKQLNVSARSTDIGVDVFDFEDVKPIVKDQSDRLDKEESVVCQL